MKLLTIERMMIVILVCLLVFVWFNLAKKPKDNYDFDLQGDVIVRLNKHTGQVHLLYRNRIVEWGTEEVFYRQPSRPEQIYEEIKNIAFSYSVTPEELVSYLKQHQEKLSKTPGADTIKEPLLKKLVEDK